MKISIFPLMLFVLMSCGGTPMAESVLPPRDKTPPVLLDYSLEGPGEMVVTFDEPVLAEGESAQREPEGGIEITGGDDGTLNIAFLPPCLPGSRNTLHLDVCDEKGNTNWFLFEFYAPNESQPDILINEISPNGSSSRPDMVEFFVRSGGNCAGMALLLGTESHRGGMYLFPDMDVETGEYIILHCRPRGDEGEISETGDDLNLSSGLRSESDIRDLWPAEDMNLSGTNGILSLVTLPVKGEIMDRVIYTNRAGKDKDKYEGWTSTLWPQIEELSAMEEARRGWYMEGAVITPEEGIPSGQTSSTRSLCRSSLSDDKDSRDDWHTVPTGNSSFGRPNTDEVYEP